MFYQQLQQTAENLIAEFGAPTTLIRMAWTYDPTSGQAQQSPVSIAVNAIVFNQNRSEEDTAQSAKWTADAYISGLHHAPKAGDELLWEGHNWRVLEVKHTAPAGQNVLFMMKVVR